MELEKAKNFAYGIKDSFRQEGMICYAESLETVLQALKNSVPKKVIEKKIEKLKEKVEDFEQTDNTGRFKKENSIDYYKLEALQELLEEE